MLELIRKVTIQNQYSKKNYALPSHRVLSSVIGMEREDSEELFLAFSCWSGTAVAHTDAGRTLRDAAKMIEEKPYLLQNGLAFPIPEPILNRKDVLLVCQHPFSVTDSDGTLIIGPERIDVLSFPANNGIYKKDARHGLPVGEPTHDEDPERGRLLRQNQYVGLVVSSGGDLADLMVYPNEVHGVIYTLF